MAQAEADSARRSPRKSADWSRGGSSGAENGGVQRIELEAVLLGSPRVGKTAIAQQFLWRKFVETYKPTVEEFNWIEYECGDDDSRTFMLKLIDTSGSPEFLAMRDLYIRKGDAFVLVHSADVDGSFEEVKRLRKAIAETNTKNAPVIVVTNKVDDSWSSDARDGDNDVRLFAAESNCVGMRATAKDYDSVEKIFRQLLRQSPYGKETATDRLKKRRQSMPANVRPSAGRSPLSASEEHPKNSCIVC